MEMQAHHPGPYPSIHTSCCLERQHVEPETGRGRRLDLCSGAVMLKHLHQEVQCAGRKVVPWNESSWSRVRRDSKG